MKDGNSAVATTEKSKIHLIAVPSKIHDRENWHSSKPAQIEVTRNTLQFEKVSVNCKYKIIYNFYWPECRATKRKALGYVFRNWKLIDSPPSSLASTVFY